MTLPAPTYDLVLLLDPQAEEETRNKIVADARAAIEAQGELVRQDEWGERALAYPIDKKPNADYHLMQFHAGSAELLSGLDRTLRITDGVMRFRIIKLKPGVPELPDAGVAAAPATRAPEPEAAAPAPVAQAPSVEAPDAEQATEDAEPAAEDPAPAAVAAAEAPDAGAAEQPEQS